MYSIHEPLKLWLMVSPNTYCHKLNCFHIIFLFLMNHIEYIFFIQTEAESIRPSINIKKVKKHLPAFSAHRLVFTPDENFLIVATSCQQIVVISLEEDSVSVYHTWENYSGLDLKKKHMTKFGFFKNCECNFESSLHAKMTSQIGF